MGRAGAGGGGGGRSFGGGHSSFRSGGGHRVGSSGGGSRARGSYSSGGFGGSRPSSGGPRRYNGPRRTNGPGMPPPRYHRRPAVPPPRRYYRTYGGGTREDYGTALGTIIIVFVIVAVIFFMALLGDSSDSPASTIVREKLESGNAYINNCIIDELGWFDNESKTESQLQEFWEETGIQPYIILKDYDASIMTDAQKEQWTIDYYDANFDTENIFLYVYFAEEDVDGDVGYMCYANGKQTSSVMDSEAIEIFWNNIDKYWYTDMSTDDLFICAFNDTADTIMHVSTTDKDITKWGIIAVVVIAGGTVLVTLVKQKNKRNKEKAAEDERILNTPLEELADDDLTNKYL